MCPENAAAKFRKRRKRGIELEKGGHTVTGPQKVLKKDKSGANKEEKMRKNGNSHNNMRQQVDKNQINVIYYDKCGFLPLYGAETARGGQNG